MKQILIVRPDTLNAKDKEKLTKNGFLYIEHPNPEEVKVIVETSSENANDVMLSALYALNKLGPEERFVSELQRRMGAVRPEPPKQ